MSRSRCIVIAFGVAIVATVVGWSQSLMYYHTPPVPTAFWFPLVVVTGAHDLDCVAVSLIQFPLFATAFAFGIQRWPVTRVLAVLALIYGALAVTALVIVKSKTRPGNSRSIPVAVAEFNR